MTIDDESSVYVGGLPYDATEETVRRVFELYGNVIAVKIINDATARGKCYGFVTFRNPRSAILAINEMDGRTVDGRVIRVNEVRSRGGRLSFGRERESFRRNAKRARNWDRARDHEMDFSRDRDRYKDRYSDQSRECDRDRSPEDIGEEMDRRYEGEHNYKHVRDHFLDIDLDQDRVAEGSEQAQSRDRDQGWERDRALVSDMDRDMDKTKSLDSTGDKDGDDQSRRWNGSNTVNRQSRDLVSHPSDDYNVQASSAVFQLFLLRDCYAFTIQMEEIIEEKEKLILDLQNKSKKLEDALINAKKNSSHEKMKITKLHKSFMQVKDYTEKLKSCEHELQLLVDTGMLEHSSDEVGLRDEILTIGNA
ncbi:zinc finger CCCH domain-containing protein 25-like isoform X2 [Pyrus x bretschneideri]|uniref:zinc finger CCCH domain-containing protein 25-like isoform X2 n=1 Tax=Pyrus x bretschneideri TaxID=225117 RepID=UPI00202E78AF|nr:zinc finger CCCH domain-containing protein 25-like isoform X2 [Pyrus x bretschneideri]